MKSCEIDIKNRTCYYFDDIININDLDLDNISLDEKSYNLCCIQNSIPYKAFMYYF